MNFPNSQKNLPKGTDNQVKTSEAALLSKIDGPQDLRGLSYDELNELSSEIRSVLIDTVSSNGGHLASNLGVVELTVALHRVFNSPSDKIIWDVGHQSYTHKLLTGRRDCFDTLRRENGISGFTRPTESEHDIVWSGHSSTSVSTAMGVAVANKLKGNKNYAVAVLGDGALTGGLIYEALNNAGSYDDLRLIIVLNDNKMSISENVGELAKYLAVIRSKSGYFKMKAATERGIDKIPFIGKKMSSVIFRLKTDVKNMIYKSNFFEDLGFRYMGPIDGHNIEQICDALEGAKLVNKPVLLHINTVKGKGYDPAEQKPSEFHGVGKFDIETGEFAHSDVTFSDVFGDFLCTQAAKDKRICAITAAMQLGTGLSRFSTDYSDRFFDVGIAEEHAIPFALGLSSNGMKPVFVVYSTFLQRCFDQILHDGALQGRNMVIAVDRAGIVGDDGETHQGIYDASFLNGIPDVTIFSPSSYSGLNNCLVKALYHTEGLVAVRYPRGCGAETDDEFERGDGDFETYGVENAHTVVVTYGRIALNALYAVKKLEGDTDVLLVKLNKIKPIDVAAVRIAAGADNVIFFEEGNESGGIGESFAHLLLSEGYCGSFLLKGIPDCFVPQGAVPSLLKRYGLDTESMMKTIAEVSRSE